GLTNIPSDRNWMGLPTGISAPDSTTQPTVPIGQLLNCSVAPCTGITPDWAAASLPLIPFTVPVSETVKFAGLLLSGNTKVNWFTFTLPVTLLPGAARLRTSQV